MVTGSTEQQDWDALYQSYTQFMSDMGNATKDELPVKSLEEFPDWINSVDGHVQTKLISDWRKGYAQVVTESDQQVAAILDGYNN